LRKRGQPDMEWGGSTAYPQRNFFELGLALLIGILFGALVILSPYLPVTSDFQKLVLVAPFAFTLAILFNNLEKLILFTVAVGVPLNLDISLIISPYARNLENLANGRTIVALTELRLGLIFMVVGIGYILWLVGKPGVKRRRVRFFPRTTFPALGLILISTLSILQAQDKQLSLFSIVQMIELFLVYFYIANHLRSKADLQFFTIILMGSILAESLLMVIQWQTGLSFSFAGINATMDAVSHRATGTLGTANSAAVIVSAYLCITCAMFWVFPRRAQKLFTGICFVVGSIALISTAGRAAWGGFIVAIFTFIFMGWQRGWVSRKALIWLLLLTLTIGAIFYPVIANRLTTDDRGSALSRVLMSKLAWNVIQASPEHFFFGVGANNYALIAPLYVTSDVGDLGHIVDSSVHNVFLLVWTEMGLIGLLIFLWFLFNALGKVWKNFTSNDRYISLMSLGLGCALLAVIIQMLADPFIARPKTMLVWLLIAMVASLDNMKTRAGRYLEKRQVYRP
jgi:O-antigen ligase